MAEPKPPEPRRDDVAPLSRSDIVLLRRAAREGWGVPDTLRTEVIVEVRKILAAGNRRQKLAAAKLLLAMDQADAKHPVKTTPPEERKRLIIPGSDDRYRDVDVDPSPPDLPGPADGAARPEG
jgi:hypothetical protein